jgi:formate dehydrogenase maturation protein FdhE
VVKATEAAGPEPLGAASRELLAAGRLEEPLAVWLAGGQLPPVERYLARASLWAPLVAIEEDAAAACADDPAPRGDRRCPHCAGPPQLSYRSDAGDRLVSGQRHLACGRCGQSWSYSGSSCPSCGETSGSRRTVYAEQRAGPVVGRDDADPETTFPHLRIDACGSCQRYLIEVDLGRDSGAVPEVDELAALPLDLYASERGLSKITPNLVGF